MHIGLPPGRVLLAALWVAASVGGLASWSAAAETDAAPPRVSPYVAGIPGSARNYYSHAWGIDRMSVKLAESGALVRFNYRVVDAAKAAPLNERSSAPVLLDEEAHAVLYVPEMEKVGPLRQSTAAEAGKTYWMVFSNKGGPVRRGHRVSVVIGQVRVDGLIVQ